MTNALLII